MAASRHGVAALPKWLIAEYQPQMPIVPVRLGRHGIAKQIFLGVRVADTDVDYVAVFMKLARKQSRRTLR